MEAIPEPVAKALGELRDRMTRSETKLEYVERNQQQQAAQLTAMDAKLDRIIEVQAQSAGIATAGKYVLTVVASAASGLAGWLLSHFTLPSP